ncbi:site-2 protease family protein [Chitinimonas sp. BJB300]|uniref:site-2 protease family protein n=1 Tax=Chitinimonas sp. BJB300 TaxID=1559339 RepID=UPI000C119205|nr:site-2 protease family protein [Chitinimonas sp. BJB300]PHV11148.1 site-2 protease family protein [Chitinimonas sp. BJB300]TSJ85568.1 site-2 protease family protein [Chitinimonas sp. BJB300]
MDDWNLIQKIAIYALPVLFAITVHEAAHGYAAKRLGDRTAEMMGRLSLNPLRHIDPIGTLLVPALALMLGGFLFGWAKPVPVDYRNLKNPKSDMLWVAAAGPASNFLMGLSWVFVLKLPSALAGSIYQEPLFYMAQAGVQINVALLVLNLLPLPPLDGGRILVSLLPNREANFVAKIEPYGIFILLGLMATGVLSGIMRPFLGAVFEFFSLFL